MILQNRYETERILGRGGFGITYLALDRSLNQLVVIKEYVPDGSAKADRKVFLQEARRLSRLFETEGIVKVLDFFEENQTAYMVMEYVRGITLEQYLERLDVPMTFREAWEFLEPVRRALKAVHKKGLIHRDVNPSNIMVTEEERLKLIDFGAARNYSENEKTMTILVKRGYAPPEQYGRKSRQGPWTDVYAFCATIYEMITGVRPEPSVERMEEDFLYPPSAYGAEISQEEEEVLMSGLELEDRKRFRSIGSLEAKMDSLMNQKDDIRTESDSLMNPQAASESHSQMKCKSEAWGYSLMHRRKSHRRTENAETSRLESRRKWRTFAAAGIFSVAGLFLAAGVFWKAAGLPIQRKAEAPVTDQTVYAGNYGRGTEKYERFVRFVQEHAVSAEAKGAMDIAPVEAKGSEDMISAEAKQPDFADSLDEMGTIVYTLPEEAVLEWNEPCNALRFFQKREKLLSVLQENGYQLTKTEEEKKCTAEIRKYGAILTNFVRTEYYRTDDGCGIRIKSDCVNEDILHVRVWREEKQAPLPELVAVISDVLSAKGEIGAPDREEWQRAYFFYPYSSCLEYYWP